MVVHSPVVCFIFITFAYTIVKHKSNRRGKGKDLFLLAWFFETFRNLNHLSRTTITNLDSSIDSKSELRIDRL